ncbi:MAG: hypothetical protein ACMXYM_05255 [Candidatus Woesearchaeota archaeon]
MKASTVVFIEESLEERFESLPDNALRRAIIRTIRALEQNAFSGAQISKRLIPKQYTTTYGITNLWKRNLPRGCRLLYTVASDEHGIICAIIDWFDHKEYERTMGY